MQEHPRTGTEALRPIVEDLLDLLVGSGDGRPHFEVVRRDRRANSVDEVHLSDGRILVVKRAHDPQNAYRFAASRAAAALLGEVDGLVGPRYVDADEVIGNEPILVYWWVPNPTLHELWPDVPEHARPAAVRSFGSVARRLGGVELPGHGSLLRALEEATPLGAWLEEDLGERLLPPVRAHWSVAVPCAEGLLEAVPDVVRAVGDAPAVLVHNDLFDQNVLCRGEPDALECVGVLDLEDAFAGPAEADAAKTELLHGPLFGQPWLWSWREPFFEGWGREPDELVVAFYRALQLLNMGLNARFIGLHAHAEALGATLAEEVRCLGKGHTHRQVHERARR